MPAPVLIAVMGPTGSGKTSFAERLAGALGAQLLNADAFQIYRGMDIGTAKPENRERYRLLDLKEPNEPFGVGEFVRLANSELQDLFREGRSAVVVGGTGLYIRALFEEYADMAEAADPNLRQELMARLRDEGLESLVPELLAKRPDAAQKIDLRNPVRVTRALERLSSPGPRIRYELPPFVRTKFALMPRREVLDASIETRHRRMVQNGWVQEVKRLLLAGYCPTDPGFRAIGYRNWASHLEGNVGLEETTATIIAETRRYAKRQRTWIRSEPSVTLIDPESTDALLKAEAHVKDLVG